MRFSPWLCAALLLCASVSFAQVEAVDPDVAADPEAPPPPPKPKPTRNDVNAVDPDAPPLDNPYDDVDDVDEPTKPKDEPDLPDPFAPRRKKPDTTPAVGKGRADAGVAGAAGHPKDQTGKTAPSSPDSPIPKGPAPKLDVQAITDLDLSNAWDTWQKAVLRKDVKAEQEARAKLLELKRTINATDVDLFAVGLLRAADTALQSGDEAAAVEMVQTATELAPSLPAVWSGAARVYFKTDPTGLGRVVGALVEATKQTFEDLRFLRPQVANIGAVFAVALIGLTIAFMVVVLLRRGKYFLHDFHFIFPRAAARWQSTALAVILLLVPIVFRMGVAPSLLLAFAAVALYASVAERVISVVLLAVLGAIPPLGGLLVEASAFADTPAESVYLLERGGPGGDELAEQLEQRVSQGKASPAELFALGHYELRRGRLDGAAARFKAVLADRPNDALAKVNLGTALFLAGDLENSRSLWEEAQTAAPQLAQPTFNLARLYQRRVQLFGDQAAGDVDRAAAAMSQARQKDFSLSSRIDAPVPTGVIPANTWVLTAPLPRSELLKLAEAPEAGKRVASQLALMVLGDVPAQAGPWYPGAVALLLLGLGALARSVDAARPCLKCGNAVSRRSDPDLSPGSQMCSQCINVFTKKNVVAPSLKVRKHAEIDRYVARQERFGTVLGLVFSGMGHVFAGLPVTGLLYGFLFLVAIVGAVMRDGWLRTPYGAVPLALRLVPLGLVFIAVYLLSIRQLRRAQGKR